MEYGSVCYSKKSFLFVVLSLITFQLKGQEPEMVFDRPGVTDTPYPGYFKGWQVEIGKDFFNLPAPQDYFPSLTIRKGINAHYETRLSLNYDPYSYYYSRFKDSLDWWVLAWGHKFQLTRQKGWMPDIALAFHVKTDIAHIRESGHFFGADLILMTQHTWGKFYFLHNTGIFVQTLESPYRILFGLCPGFQVTPQWGIFGEYFLHKDLVNPLENGADIGVTYLIKNRYQIDVCSGFIFSSQQDYWAGVGFSFYVQDTPRKKKMPFIYNRWYSSHRR